MYFRPDIPVSQVAMERICCYFWGLPASVHYGIIDIFDWRDHSMDFREPSTPLETWAPTWPPTWGTTIPAMQISHTQVDIRIVHHDATLFGWSKLTKKRKTKTNRCILLFCWSNRCFMFEMDDRGRIQNNEHLNKPAAQAAGADPSQWSSTNRQNPPLH